MPATLLATKRVEKPWGRHHLFPGFPDPAPDAGIRPEIERRGHARDCREVYRTVMPRSGDVQQQQFRFHLTHGSIVLQHRPMQGDGRETTGQAGKEQGECEDG